MAASRTELSQRRASFMPPSRIPVLHDARRGESFEMAADGAGAGAPRRTNAPDRQLGNDFAPRQNPRPHHPRVLREGYSPAIGAISSRPSPSAPTLGEPSFLPSCAGEERSDDVRGVPVEGNPGPVVTHRGPRIGVAGRLLYVPKRDTGIQGAHFQQIQDTDRRARRLAAAASGHPHVGVTCLRPAAGAHRADGRCAHGAATGPWWR